MTKLSKTSEFERYDIVVVPFPYTENLDQAKKRPALVLTDMHDFNAKTGLLVCAMITTSKKPWPGDTQIKNIKKAGLPVECSIRMKLFTIDATVVIRHTGKLDKADSERFQSNFSEIMGL